MQDGINELGFSMRIDSQSELGFSMRIDNQSELGLLMNQRDVSESRMYITIYLKSEPQGILNFR